MKRLATITVFLFLSGITFGQDLLVTSLQNPSDGCELSATESIFVTIWNNSGVTHAGNFDVSYTLNNGPVVTVSNNTNIGPSAVYNFTFPVPDDFSACQVHDLKVWVTGGLDANHANDTLWASVISDCPAVTGNISGTDVICEGINNDSVFVTGQNGAVIGWQSSPDGVTWSTYLTSNDYYEYTNLPGSTIWRVIVDSPFGICGPDTSAWFTILADQQSDAGILPADFDICDNGNAGQIYTTGFYGSILGWLLSTNGGAGWIPVGGAGSDTLDYTNLQNTTQYVVIVQNGVCPPDTSAMINLNLIQGTVPGAITGPSVVCNLENNDSLVASGGNGTVIGWNISSDGGVTWQPTLVGADSVFTFSGLGSETWFQAIWEFGNCPQETAEHSVITLPVITDEIPDTTIMEGDAINLYVVGGSSWTWWPDQFIDDVNSSTPIVDPDSDITYWCEVVSIEGCKDTIRVVVTVQADVTTLLIPNLITPNADGHNDTWQIGNIQTFTENELIIFNAYGQVVYSASPYNNEWGGTFNNDPLPDGTYFYQLDLKLPEDDPNYREPIKGVVTIAGSE